MQLAGIKSIAIAKLDPLQSLYWHILYKWNGSGFILKSTEEMV